MDRQAIADALWDLRTLGFAMVAPIAPAAMAEVNAFLLSRPVYLEAHIPETARKRGDALVPNTAADTSSCICLPLRDALLAPHLFERALALTDLAAAYLEREPPVAYSTNVFWTQHVGGTRPDIQEFHRDADDERFVAMFAYLTDVLANADGPHELEGPDGIARRVLGPAGTVFLADTSHIHRGIKPAAGWRGIAWFRWGVSDRPAAYMWDRNEPIEAAELGPRYPADARLRESIKLLVRP